MSGDIEAVDIVIRTVQNPWDQQHIQSVANGRSTGQQSSALLGKPPLLRKWFIDSNSICEDFVRCALIKFASLIRRVTRQGSPKSNKLDLQETPLKKNPFPTNLKLNNPIAGKMQDFD